MKKLIFNSYAEAPAAVESTFASKLATQLEKQKSKTEVIDKLVTIKNVGPVVTKDGEVQENRLRIIDTTGTVHYCFKNQVQGNAEKLIAGMKATISYREKGEYINIVSVTPDVAGMNAQSLAYFSGNAIVIPAL
jgi:hypothetical protein